MQKSLDEPSQTCYTVFCSKECATVAQQVEQLTRNEQVVRSNRISSSKNRRCVCIGGFPFQQFPRMAGAHRHILMAERTVHGADRSGRHHAPSVWWDSEGLSRSTQYGFWCGSQTVFGRPPRCTSGWLDFCRGFCYNVSNYKGKGRCLWTALPAFASITTHSYRGCISPA